MPVYVCECHDEVEEITDVFMVEAESRRRAEEQARDSFCDSDDHFDDYCYCACVEEGGAGSGA